MVCLLRFVWTQWRRWNDRQLFLQKHFAKHVERKKSTKWSHCAVYILSVFSLIRLELLLSTSTLFQCSWMENMQRLMSTMWCCVNNQSTARCEWSCEILYISSWIGVSNIHSHSDRHDVVVQFNSIYSVYLHFCHWNQISCLLCPACVRECVCWQCTMESTWTNLHAVRLFNAAESNKWSLSTTHV